MKLYVTFTSPYARIVRAAVLEKGLADRVTVIEAQTRQAGSPYYALNPSGRVPFLVRDDGVGMEDSQAIVAYLDSLDGRQTSLTDVGIEDWGYRRLEAYARSFLDGVSVWVREMRRPEHERSPTILSHESARAARLADFWESEVAAGVMNGPLNMAQLLLIAGIDFAAHGKMADYTDGRTTLAAWARRIRQRPSLMATAPGLPRPSTGI